MSTTDSIIGVATPRIDGPLKTTGAAQYSADFHFEHMAHAVPVGASVASGRIRSLDASAAEQMPGVILVLHHGNIGPLYRTVPGDDNATNSEVRSALEDDVVRHWGQHVAVVVAETLEQATAAAAAVKIDYEPQPANLRASLDDYTGERKSVSKRGNPDEAFASAPVKIDYTYITPNETHNPHPNCTPQSPSGMGDRVTLYETSQGVVNHRVVMAQVLGLPLENVRVVTRFLGSGFGGKLFPWPHTAMAAVAAKRLNRPVKLSLDRRMMFSAVGYRPRTEQRIKLGAAKDGKLLALRHDYLNVTSQLDDFNEGCGEATPYLYSVANLEVTSGLVRRHVGAPMYMRGPGAVPGLYALEAGMNELADALQIDPLQLRLINDAEKDESTNTPFSSRHLKECFEVGAKKFGWEKRSASIGAMRADGKILGWGMAGASWVALRLPCTASVEFCANGRLCVRCGTQDIGTGTYTVFAQVLSEKTGIHSTIAST